jgi:hypothetical protein
MLTLPKGNAAYIIINHKQPWPIKFAKAWVDEKQAIMQMNLGMFYHKLLAQSYRYDFLFNKNPSSVRWKGFYGKK